MKFELTQNEKGEWWFEAVSRNGRKLGNQWYSREAGAMKAIEAIVKGCVMADGIDKLITRKPWTKRG
jgi:uncharacterized protein YegP (UPF0339 family)